jgi:hypothetical protein
MNTQRACWPEAVTAALPAAAHSPAAPARRLGGQRIAAATVALAALTVLTACGGGDDDAGLPLNTPYAVQEANRQLLVTGGSWSATGRGTDNRIYRLSMTIQPLANGVFPVTGVNARRASQTLTLTADGVAPVVAVDTLYFALDSEARIGARHDDNVCSVATGNFNLPTTAVAGGTGNLYTDSSLASCAPNAAVTGSSTVRWSLTREVGFTMFCTLANVVDNIGDGSGTVDLCVEITPDGTLRNRVQLGVQLTELGFGLNARNFD